MEEEEEDLKSAEEEEVGHHQIRPFFIVDTSVLCPQKSGRGEGGGGTSSRSFPAS